MLEKHKDVMVINYVLIILNKFDPIIYKTSEEAFKILTQKGINAKFACLLIHLKSELMI